MGKLTVCNDEIMKDIYKKFAYIQNKRLQQFGELEAVFNARTPILKFVHIDSGLKCDLSFSNRMAWMNSKFIKKCLEVDSRYVHNIFMFEGTLNSEKLEFLVTNFPSRTV